jgi:hypothetical protein
MSENQRHRELETDENVQDIIRRYNNDPDFKIQVDKDPLATLQAEGISTDDIPSVLSALNFEADVVGYVWIPTEEFDDGGAGSNSLLGRKGI